MRNQRPADPAEAAASVPPSGSGLRLRHALLLALLGVAAWVLVPRAQAAWQLRERATQFADYALCMAGPTGPELLRDGSPVFGELVRRRLIVSGPSAAPFAACADLATSLSGSEQVGVSHRALAEQFLEYSQGSLPLSQLSVSARVLSDLAARAWPFERKGYSRLVRPSSHAKEAQHPVPFVAAAVGTGLPGWRGLYRSTWTEAGRWYLAQGHAANLVLFESVDWGSSWKPAAPTQAGLAKHAGRCMSQGADRAFTFESSSGALLVHSLLGDEIQSTARVNGQWGVLTASCDDQAAVLALENSAEGGQRLPVLCEYGAACGQLTMPLGWLDGAFDLARIDGVTVSIRAEQGVVRARSSRDNGGAWTSASIAFDWQTPDSPRTDVPVPSRLLKLGRRLLLHGEGKAGQTYPLLFSDDYGASWHGADVAGKPRVQVGAPRVSQR